MTFNSLQFALFLPIVLGLYWLLGRRGQNRLLLAASYFFYGTFDYRFLALLLTSTVVDYNVGRWLDRPGLSDRRRKQVFAASIVTNLGILGFFKYVDFFQRSAQDLLGRLGVDVSPHLLRVALPLGISFYTFHGMSYTFDVYRRQLRPARDLTSFAVFVAYFPQLVAGPIGRASIQLPQFENDRARPRPAKIRSGSLLILQGLFKKVAIADVMAPIANSYFASAKGSSTLPTMVGVYAFALQIYGDFSGYSDIARGTSRLFGIELLRNFNQPYLSTSVTAFWRRWHISLSGWLRDYLYVPLGGNRRGRTRTYINLMLTMLIGGLWHGAAWTFVVWGGLHGLFLAVERWGADHGLRLPGDHLSQSRVAALVKWFITFHLVCGAWIFFRASSFGQAGDVLRSLLNVSPTAPDGRQAILLVYGAIATLALDAFQTWRGSDTALLKTRPVVRGLAYAVMILFVIMASGSTPVPFIYFRF